MRILALVSRPMSKPLSGGTLRPYHILSNLARRHEVHLLYFARDRRSAEEMQSQPAGLSKMEAVPFSGKWAALKAILSIPTSTPAQVAYLSSNAMRRAVRNACESFEPDILFVHMARMAQYAQVPSGEKGVPAVLDLVDSFSLHLGSYAPIGRMRSRALMRLETKKMARYECGCVAKVKLSFGASERDVQAVKSSPYFRGGRIEVLPNGVDTGYFTPKETDRDDSVVFVGNFAYPPNEDAALWFAGEVFPKVLESVPSAKFVVVGMNPSVKVLSLARPGKIEVTGEVPDVRPYLWRAGVSVAPLRKAGGSQYKVLEAMACGTPSVVTPGAAAGIDAVPGRDFEVARTGADFAAKVSNLLKDRARARGIATAGRALVEQKYGWPGIVGEFEQIIAR